MEDITLFFIFVMILGVLWINRRVFFQESIKNQEKRSEP